MKSVIKTLCIFMGAAFLIYLFSCERNTSPANPNFPPNTTIANIPVDSSTIFALVTMHWDGEDDDGFIAGYQYSYITYHQDIGDSAIHEWENTTETSLTIAFESSDNLNFQKFYVRAVDNMGDVDPTPAEKHFYTPKTIFPEAEILSPVNNEKFFTLEEATDWWPGIKLIFTASDEDGEVVEFAWAVDDGEWNWVQDTLLYIKPDNFDPLDGEHKIRVTCRDNTNLVAPKGDSVIVNLIRPTFDKRILIVDETIESNFPANIDPMPTDAGVDSFYADIFGIEESWDFKQNGMPPKEVLGQYKLVIWHADNLYTTENKVHKLPQHIDDIMDYLNVGGDFIMSGWKILKSFADTDPFPRAFEEGEFIHDYLHITQVDETAKISDFIGAEGSGGFSDISVDSAKVAGFPYNGMLNYINLMPERAGFTDKMYIYKNKLDSPFGEYRGQTCGLRYYGSVFDAAVLGFPVYFIKKEDARTLVNEILVSMGY
jgi:hypothetical protein